ncbi:MAG TPA: hypothetical protein DCG69_06015 [Bacteroidales bacterium]|nr:hypothetical protein [Bacteroidales bacterium]
MQANKYKLLLLAGFIAIFFLANSCVEEYWPELDTAADQLLVVDGKISNFPGPYTVKLSYSSAINQQANNPISLAKVSLVDNLGNTENFVETSPGNYSSSASGMQGIVGRSYKIKIQLSNGKKYESDFEELKPTVDVENLLVEESVQLAKNDLETDQEGYQFYVNSKVASSTKTYFYWEIEETYEYHSDYRIIFLYRGRRYPITDFNPYGLAKVVNEDTLFYCWKTQPIPERFSYSTEYLSSPVIKNLPLHFIPFTDERLRYKYSILVNQYSISENAYTFLDQLNKQNNSEDALFTTQPFQIRGNIKNLDDSKEAVLGYFMVASGTKSNHLLTKAPSRIRYSSPLSFADTSSVQIKNVINTALASSYPIYFTFLYFQNPNVPLAEADEVIAYVERQECIDCQKKGGTAKKPDYWDW